MLGLNERESGWGSVASVADKQFEGPLFTH